MEEFLTKLWEGLGQFAINYGFIILGTLLMLLIGPILIKWVLKLIKRGKKFSALDANTQTLIVDIVKVILYVLLIALIAVNLGVEGTAIAATITSCGLAIGLALQGSLSNFAGGIMILVLRPFRVGDFVELAGKSGTVTDVGIFYTTLTTPDNKVITIPNGTVMSSEIVNYSVKDTRRVDLVFNVAYGTDVDKVRSILLEEAGKHSLTLDDPAPFARLTKQNEHSMDFTLRVWAKAGDYWTVNFDLLENINNRFAKEGIEIPFHQLDVHIKDQK